jgi:ElaB/YqjD/DUF883 family membrane-anchored ribosome-binding protein
MKTITTKSTREALLNDVGTLKRDAIRVAQDVQNHANAHVGETKKRVNDTIQYARENVVAHPFTILGVGFVLGLLVGFRLRR